jgi:hypothetical protein
MVSENQKLELLHLGDRISNYLKSRFVDKLQACESFTQKNYKQALEQTFLTIEKEVKNEPEMVGNIGSTASVVILTAT